MADTFKLKITTPERVVYENDIDQISVPTPQGEITVLPHHIALVSQLSAGEMVVKKGIEEIPMAISGGFLEVTPSEVVILADTAERAEEIDEARAEEARQRAEELLKEKKVDDVEYAGFAAKLEKELARLRVARRRRRMV